MRVLPPLERLSGAQLAAAALAVALTPVVVAAARVVRRKMRAAEGLAPIPGPPGVPLLGIFPALVQNFERWYDFQEELMIEHGGRCKLPPNIFTDGTIMLASAEDVKHVLGTNVNNYVKSDAMVDAFRTLFGNSFFCLNHAHAKDGGAMWRLQRKVSAKVFTTTNFKLFTQELFVKYAREMADGVAAQGGRCNMADVSTHYTLRTIFDITCGVPVQQVDAAMGLSFMRCITFAVNNIIDRLLKRPYYRYLWWCMPSEYQLKRDVAVVRRIMDYILAPRLAESDAQLAKRSDILSLFIQKARELEGGEGQSVLDVDTLRDVLGTYIIAGWDTTASFITYLCYALAQYPDVQQKVYDELQELGADDDTLTYDGVKKLKYLDAVAMETQRVYPSLPFNTKIAVHDDHLPDGTFVPAGTEVVYSAWYMGRHSALWGDDPLVFRPERWLEMQTRPSAFEFPNFQAGPRICIGMNLALLESKMFVAVMLQRFHMQIQDGERVANRPYKMATILLLDGGLPLQMTPRVQGPAKPLAGAQVE